MSPPLKEPGPGVAPRHQEKQNGSRPLNTPAGNRWASAAASSPAKPNRRDITARSSSMPRNSAILYRNWTPKPDDPPAYYGLLKLADGSAYWAAIWARLVNGEPVVELQLTPKNAAQK